MFCGGCLGTWQGGSATRPVETRRLLLTQCGGNIYTTVSKKWVSFHTDLTLGITVAGIGCCSVDSEPIH